MNRSVEERWIEVVDWLVVNAPATFETLVPRATASEVDAVEAAVPEALPNDLRAWLRFGQGVDWQPEEVFPPLFAPRSARDVLTAYRRLVAEDERTWPGYERAVREGAGGRSGVFLKSFVPIASSGTGDWLFVDLRPGAWHGCVQRWRRDDGCQVGPLWRGVGDMLADVVQGLITGREVLAPFVERAHAQGFRTSTTVPVVENGRLGRASRG
ncbi:SMI1/KNR4 family protein [Saccharothrix violaceirubra]|uniref:Cell wall assembly regulator SMI1 n=1 Tax=Saccharothrix violaceirubra TaxID=413306 RepID=A0A7W7T3U9_9PSEU|nr:SMI1/KNR4 family protein [Saccharothrix violaceirubra]MBB4966074.1 cell wall assembly regulator SMI1 [Saccharothrix violaceirubra]